MCPIYKMYSGTENWNFVSKSTRRITQGKEQIDRLLKHKSRPFILIQTKTSYERYHLIQYVKSHKLKFKVVQDTSNYTKYVVDDYSRDNPSIDEYIEKKFGPDLEYKQIYYKRPVKFIKVYRK